jgi:YfiH family protein
MYQSSLIDDIADVSHGFGHAGVELASYVNDGVVIHRTRQVHGGVVHVLGDEPREDVLEGDAFISSRPNVACFVRTADCMPILVVDSVTKAVGAIHAGWRSTVRNIIGATIEKMAQEFGSKPEDMCAAIGPAICGSCYEVGRDVVDAFLENDMPADGRVLSKHDGRTLLNMEWAAEELLTRAHVPRRNIDVIKRCTLEDPNLASYRRDKTDVRQVSFILSRPR